MGLVVSPGLFFCEWCVAWTSDEMGLVGGCLGWAQGMDMDMDDAGADDCPMIAVAIDAATAWAEMQVTWFSTG